MKTINETFTDEEIIKILSAKNYTDLSWHDWILMCAEKQIIINERRHSK